MTSLQTLEAVGVQRPRVLHLPPEIHSTSGLEFAEQAAAAGLHLDPWQTWSLNCGLAERADGQWSALEVAQVVSRQNGKGSIIEALELGGLFLLKLPLVLHTAHEFKTAQEGFRRVLHLVQNCPDLDSKVGRVRTSHGEEGIELKPQHGGGRLRFIARSGGSGRGFSAPLVILDEAYALQSAAIAALMPTLSAQPNPQLWSFSSAAMSTSTYLHRLRRRALAGNDGERLAYMEWSVDLEVDDPASPASWAKANPALGIRIDPEFVAMEMAAMPPEVFLRERLGVPDPESGAVAPEIDEEAWVRLGDPASEPSSGVVFIVDVSPGGRSASIAMGGVRPDGRRHVELVDHRRETFWVADRRRQLEERFPGSVWALDPSGPAVEFRSNGVWREISPKESGEAFAGFLAGVRDDQVRWRSSEDLEKPVLDALAGAVKGVHADGVHRWSRRRSSVDISPLVALTLADWAGVNLSKRVDPLRVLL